MFESGFKFLMVLYASKFYFSRLNHMILLYASNEHVTTRVFTGGFYCVTCYLSNFLSLKLRDAHTPRDNCALS